MISFGDGCRGNVTKKKKCTHFLLQNSLDFTWFHILPFSSKFSDCVKNKSKRVENNLYRVEMLAQPSHQIDMYNIC